MARDNLTERTAQAVAQAILAAGESQTSVSRKSGIPYTTLQNKIHGDRPFNVEDLRKIARALGITPGALLPTEFFETEAA